MDQPLTINEEEMTPALDRAILANLRRAFAGEPDTVFETRSWHGSRPAFSAYLDRDGAVVAHAGVVDRTIKVGGISLRIAGVQNVFVVPEARGGGNCQKVMNLAMIEAMKRGFDLGLLFCIPKLEKTYASCGWINLGEREAIRVEEGRELPLPGKNIAMYHPLKLTQFPDGIIHLCGNDW